MTSPKGKSEFCVPETLNVPQGEAEGNIEIWWRLSVLLYLPTQNRTILRFYTEFAAVSKVHNLFTCEERKGKELYLSV